MARPKGSKDKKPRVRSGNYKTVECVCIRCGQEFSLRKIAKNSRGLCLVCRRRDNIQKFREKHPGYNLDDKRRAQRRYWNLMSKYGMSLQEYDDLLKKQGGVCAICRKEQTRGHSLCVDHNHETGQNRGLLCHKCNQALGLLQDRATNAAQYLLSHAKLSWDEYFMNIAILVSSRSKDKSTKVGAVIVKDRVIVSTGYNGFPRGIDDDRIERHERPLKYQFTCHAEENAIFNAARIGAKVAGSDIYVTLHPCTECSKAIIQSQIKRVIVLSDCNDRWTDDFQFSRALLTEGGVDVIFAEYR